MTEYRVVSPEKFLVEVETKEEAFLLAKEKLKKTKGPIHIQKINQNNEYENVFLVVTYFSSIVFI